MRRCVIIFSASSLRALVPILIAMTPFHASLAAPRLAFITSTGGTGNMGSWADAGGNVGLAAGDAICAARATAANLPEPQAFVAWLSDSTSDAYCRLQGFSGKKSANCGQPNLPTGAGPWTRTDGVPFMGRLDDIETTNAVYSPLTRDEFKALVGSDVTMYSGTFADGSASTRNCGDWLTAFGNVDFGSTYGTYPDWTHFAGYSFCNISTAYRIGCLQKGAGDSLTLPLPHGHKQAFVTSIKFAGNLGAAAQAGGHTGVEAGDAICRSLAQSASLVEPQSYKALLVANGASAVSRFQNDGPWDRVDGLRFADSFAQMAAGAVGVPLNATEHGAYVSGTDSYAWSGVDPNGGIGAQTCGDWAISSYSGWASIQDRTSPRWPAIFSEPKACQVLERLYCLSDSDLLFRHGME